MNEIALYTVSDLSTMATAIAKSGLFGMKTPEQAMALMLVAQAENLHPATITQDYDIIQGKACRKTHSVMARFQQMGGKVEWIELTDKIAKAEFSHPKGGSVVIEWTIEQAQKAGLTGKDNWRNYPRPMLRSRCIAEGVRTILPAAIGGMMVVEEAQDAPSVSEPRDMGAAEVVQREEIKPELPSCPSDTFAKNLAKVTAALQSGDKTPDHVIAQFRTRYTLTEAQEQAIKDAAIVVIENNEPDPFIAEMEAAERAEMDG